MPVLVSEVRNALVLGPVVPGSPNAVEVVEPTMTSASLLALAIELIMSLPEPPMYVEYCIPVNVELNFVTNPSVPPSLTAWRGFLVGKFVEVVDPATMILPKLSRAIAEAVSVPLPPR